MIHKTISHYKILEKLGEGGMGVVYRADDTKLERHVALKFLSPRILGTDREKARFVREAKAAAALNHPNICTIHEIDEADGQTFIAMECVEGQSLKARIESGSIALDETLAIAAQIAEGLAEAHAKGIVHRDIKPANIVVTPKGRVKIMDFGLARSSEATQLTAAGTTVGTVAYMSPEQARGDCVDHRTDIWSLGVILYEMTAGRRPFRGDRDQAVIYSILNEEPEPPSAEQPGISGELEHVVCRMLAKDRASRHQGAEEVLADLNSIRGVGETITSTRQVDARKRTPSVAVLPFLDMSPQRDQEYFCEGMAEELINALTHLGGLKVSARTSSFQFKGPGHDVRKIGRDLGVVTVLEGSVRKAGSRLRITAQLISVTDGCHLWSEKYDRDMEDIFAVQDEIGLAVADKLKVKLLGEEKAAIARRRTLDPEAHNLYLKGIYFLRKYTPDGFSKAIGYFERALEKDPDYALAYYGLAEVFYVCTYWGNMAPNEAYPRAKMYVNKALEIDDTLGEAHAALGFVYASYDWNWKLAEGELKQALQLNPSSAMVHMSRSWLLSLTQRHDDAVIEARRAQELDPLSNIVNTHVGLACIWGSQYDNAIEELQMTLTMDPSFYLAHYYLGLAYRGKSMIEEAVAEFEKAVELGPGTPWPATILATTYFMIGKKAEGERLFQSLKRRSQQEYVPPMGLFYIHLARRELDQALFWLEQACIQHDNFLPWCNVIPIDCYRIPDEARFRTVLIRAGLEQ